MLNPHVHAGPRVAEELADLANRVDRLIPSRHDPQHYHAEKSEIAFKLRQLAHIATVR